MSGPDIDERTHQARCRWIALDFFKKLFLGAECFSGRRIGHADFNMARNVSYYWLGNSHATGFGLDKGTPVALRSGCNLAGSRSDL